MSLTLVKDGLTVDLAARQAVGRFVCDSRADLPGRGAAAAWVKLGDDDLGGGWAVAGVEVEAGIFNLAVITARQAGFNWTWCDGDGDPLRPIATRHNYRLISSTKNVNGVVLSGYWPVFSNWDDDDNWTCAEPDPLTDKLRTWEIEFVSTSQYSAWHQHVNGTWPTGLTPPVTGAGVYRCQKMQIEEEPWTDADDGDPVIYYRHFGVFWEAPSLNSTQLTWRGASW